VETIRVLQIGDGNFFCVTLRS